MAVWAEILRRVPNSRFLFHFPFEKGPQIPFVVRDPIVRFFRARGISSKRLTFCGYRPVEEHLALISTTDIALDTFPYAGMTTTFDSLWMGVPVVTMSGEAHVSRTGVSLLSGIGLRNWIASSPEQYVNIAVREARDPQSLSRLRGTLRPAMANSILTNGQDYVRSLESAFLEMWNAIGGPRSAPRYAEFSSR
jgi:predicted O-linked N-acetylglucosamine transferase (SPINDLY family)